MRCYNYGTYVEQCPSDTALLVREDVTFLFSAHLMSSLADICIQLAEQRESVSYSDLCQKFHPPFKHAIKYNSDTLNSKGLFSDYVYFWNKNCEDVSALDFSCAISALVYLCDNNRRHCDDVHYFFWTVESHLNAMKRAKKLSLSEV